MSAENKTEIGGSGKRSQEGKVHSREKNHQRKGTRIFHEEIYRKRETCSPPFVRGRAPCSSCRIGLKGKKAREQADEPLEESVSDDAA